MNKQKEDKRMCSIINEFKISFLSVYSLNQGENISGFIENVKRTRKDEYWIKKCNNADKDCIYPCSEVDFTKCNLANSYMFSITSDFHFHGQLPYEYERIELDNLKIKIEIAGKERDNSCSVILTYFPEESAFMIMLNFKLSDFSIDELVFLRQCFYNTYKFNITESSCIGKDKSFSISEIIEWYSMNINTNIDTAQEALKYTVLEINDFRTISEINLDDDYFIKELYGLLTCDEGWEYATFETIKNKISNTWGTREFVKIMPYYDSCLVLNLVNSPLGQEYYENQKQFGMKYYGGVNQYFLYNPKIAGLNHGVFFSIESALVMRVILNRTIKRDYTYGRSRQLNQKMQNILKTRKGMIETLSKLDFFGIGEIDELERLLLTNMGIYTDIEKVKYYLELTESDIMIKYQHKTNILIVLLTIANLIFALLSIIITFLGSIEKVKEVFANIF